MTQLSTRGAQFIARFEGFRSTPYNDAVGNATIGYGHLIHMGPVTAHDNAEWGTLSEADGLALLQRDASVAEMAIDHYITRQLDQHERDALASFVFNCGGGALSGSVGQSVNAGTDPSPTLEQWDHAGHTVLEGLLVRRQKEAHLYVTGDYGDGQPADGDAGGGTHTTNGSTTVPQPVPPWAWTWVEWKLGRAQFKGHAGDPALRHLTGAPAQVPPWSWVFLKKFG